MIQYILALALASNVDYAVFRQADGGITVRSWCDGVSSGGGSGSGPSYVNVLVDAGSISVNNFPATQPVSGTLTCNAGSGTFAVSGPLTDAQLRATAVPVSLSSTTISGTVAATQSGTWTNTVTQATGTNLHVVVDSAPTTAVTGTFWQATQPVSGTLTCNAGSGTLAVSGPLTDAQLRATAVPVSLTSTTITGTPTVTSRKVAAAALTQAINCATSATALPTTPLTNRTSVCVQNMGASVVYVGHSAVTTANGIALAPASGTTPGGSFCDDLGSQPLYCIVASGTVEVRLLEN